MMAKILLWCTPLVWLCSLELTGYGTLFTAPLVVVALGIAAALHRQEHRGPASAAVMFAAIWWVIWPSSVAAVLVAGSLLLPKRFWAVGAVAIAALIVCALLNPPFGPGHLASVAGITLVVHATLVGAVALVAIRRTA